MRIKKVLNNNFVIVEDPDESIAMGIGIGFGKKAGDHIQDYEIDKVFRPSKENHRFNLAELFQEISIEIVDLSDEIITYGCMKLGNNMSDSIYIALMDHIHSTVERAKGGIYVPNVLLLDIKRFYSEEYRVGLYGKNRIEEEFGVSLYDDEAGFIALHFVNAMCGSSNNYTYDITMFLKNVVAIVERRFEEKVDIDSLEYYRFVNHLRFLAQRLFSGSIKQPFMADQKLFKIIQKEYDNSYQATLEINDYIQKEYDKKLYDEELLYLTIHIERLFNKNIF